MLLAGVLRRLACVAVAIGAIVGCGPTTRPPHTHLDEPSPDDDETPLAAPEGPIGGGGNTRVRSFDAAKKELRRIYGDTKSPEAHTDVYCGCSFLPRPGQGFTVDLDTCGYGVVRDRERAGRIEWEHAVAASQLGHTFSEWRDGHSRCVDRRGKSFKGRRCARLASAEFARMEADLHNLFPVVGEVNALRGDLPMGVPDPKPRRGGDTSFRFGRCATAIDHGVFLPRDEARGELARAAKYMDRAYPDRDLLDEAHRAVFDRWDREDPPSAWEIERNERIAACQGNDNPFVTKHRRAP